MKKAAAEKAAPAQPETLGFEDALKRLTAIVERLESGELSLEQSLSLFEEGTRLSRTSLAVVKRMLKGETVTQETSGLTKREWVEFQAAIAE